MNVVLYLRVSTEKQDTSIADQRVALTRYAREHRYHIVAEYVDEWISGDNTEKRLAFQRMIAESSAGQFSTILCWDQDRFGRFDALEAGYWIKPLKDAGIVLETIAQGRIDWTDFAGRMLYAIQQEGKHAYLRDLSRNVARGMWATVEAGKWPGGPAPFGYRLVDGNLAIHAEEADLVRELFRRFLAGDSSRDLAVWLNQIRVPSPRGRRWASNSVLIILRQELYTGVLVWNRRSKSRYSRITQGVARPARPAKSSGEPTNAAIRLAGHHPAIIDQATFEAVAKAIPGRRRRTTPAKARTVFAFSGLLRCGACGGPMHGRRRYAGLPYYCCWAGIHTGECHAYYVAQSVLLERIRQVFRDMLSSPADRRRFIESVSAGLHAEPRDNSRQNAGKRLAAIEARLTQAKRRLVECDRDMLPLVQEQIREMQEESFGLQQLLSAPEPRSAKAVATEWIERAAGLENLFRGETDAASVRSSLCEFITRIDVHCGTDVHKDRTKRRFWLERLVLHLKAGDATFPLEA